MKISVGIKIGDEFWNENTGTLYRVTGRDAGRDAVVDILDIDDDGSVFTTGTGYLTLREIARMIGARSVFWDDPDLEG